MLSGLGRAAEAGVRPFEVPAGPAVVTLKRAAQQAEVEIAYAATIVAGIHTNAVSGNFTPHEALERLVAGTPLRLHYDPHSGAFSVRRLSASPLSSPASPPPNTAAPPMKSRNPLSSLLLAAAAIVSPTAFAQTVSSPASGGRPSDDEAVVLSPFMVQSDRESGYQATSTLAGTRISTEVKDIGSSISIYTKDLLNDLGIANVSEVLVYATGMELGGPSGNFSGSTDTSAQVVGEGVRTNSQGSARTRGLTGPNYTRNLFNTSIPGDSYNTQTVTVNRGPNAVLFGIGSPAGVVDTTLSPALLHRNEARTEFRTDQNGSLRSLLDVNRIVIPRRLAVRFAALDDQEHYNQKPAFEHKERVYGAIAIRPFERTTFRANFESGRSKANRPITILPFNSISPLWYALQESQKSFDWRFYDDPDRNPNARTQSSSSFVPLSMGQVQIFNQIALVYNQPTQALPSAAFKTEVPGGNSANQVRTGLFHPVFNRDAAADNIQFYGTRNLGELPAAAFPGGTLPSLVQFESFKDSSAFDWTRRMLDSSSRQTHRFRNFNVSLEQLFWRDRIGVELAYNKEHYSARNRNSFFQGPNNNHIRIDTNVTLPNGQPNPNVGRPYAQYGGANWTDPENSRENFRATAFLRYDFREARSAWARWLGRHSLTGLYEEYVAESLSNNTRLATYGPAADAVAALPNSFSRRPTLLVYVGDSILNGQPLRLQPINITQIDAGLTIDTFYFASPASSTVQGDGVVVPTTLVWLAKSPSGAVANRGGGSGTSTRSPRLLPRG